MDDFSMASVDTNPTFDQFDDGGMSGDYSATVQSVANLGSELAGIVAGFTGPSQQTPVYPNYAPPIAPPKSSNNAAMILVVIVVLGVGWVVIGGMKAT